MISDEELDAAVAAGRVPAETAAALRAHVAERRQRHGADEENFRLLSGFNDIFVVIACALLLLPLGFFVGQFAHWAGAAAVAGTAWLLAEFFVRRRRMALPAITLMLGFLAAVAFAGSFVFEDSALGRAAACAVATLAAGAHWRRFRVPATVAASVLCVLGCAINLMHALRPADAQRLAPLFFAAGVVAFALALYWDSTDRRRQTERADTAFWLHLLAAPLLVHPVFTAIDIPANGASGGQLLLVLLLYLLLAVVSLAIDRRALMVSALGYVLFAVASRQVNNDHDSDGVALPALLIGGALLLMSAGWQRYRALVLRLLPSAIVARLVPAD